MVIVLDTDVLVAGARGGFDLGRWLADTGESTLALASITVAELYYGLERMPPEQRARRQAFIDRVLTDCDILPYGPATAAIHARIWAQAEAGRKMIRAHDLVVAATALEHDCPVATFNTWHFASVHDLMVIQPA